MIGGLLTRLFVRLVAVLAMAALVAGIPWMLATLIGWPLPSDLPSWDEVVLVLSSAPTERTIMNTLAVVAWVVWVAFLWSLAGEVAALARHGPADRRTQPAGRNPARMVAAVLFTAIATGSLAHTTAAATAIDVNQPTPAATATQAVPQASTTAAPSADQPTPQQPVEPPARPGYRAALWEDPPPLPHAPGSLAVEAAGQRYDYQASADATLWDLADTMLGDPRRWPEIRDLNPGLGHTSGAGNGQVILLPDDATVPATDHTTTTAAAGADNEQHQQVAEQLVYEVAEGDWMWHIAGRYLGDEQRYPEIAQLNPDLAARYPDFPDHIQPGDQLLLPDDARDRGQRPHATGLADTTEPEPEPPEAPEAPQQPTEPPAEPPASPSPPASPGLPPSTVAPSSPAPTTAPSPGPSAAGAPGPSAVAPQTTSPAAPGSGPGEQAGQPDEPEHDDQPSDAGVVLPTGAWVSFGLAALITAAAVLLRLHRRRRARLHTRPIPTSAAPAEPPLPESLRLAEDAGLQVLDFDDDTTMPGVLPAPPTPAAVGVGAIGEQVSLFTLPGNVVALHGAGAQAAVRAMLAAALGTGVTEHTGMQPRVIITGDMLAGLLPEGTPAVGLDPHGDTFDGERLEVVADEAAAVTRWEEEMFHRRRMCDQHDADTVGQLVARDEHPEHLPPVVLFVAATTRLLPRLQAVAVNRQALLLHTVLLGHPGGDLPTWRVDPDGTTTTEASSDADQTPEAGSGSTVQRLSTLGAEELAAVLDVVSQVAPRTEPGHDDTATSEPAEAGQPLQGTAAETPAMVPTPAGEHPPLVRLRVLGPPQLATDAGPITEGVRTGSVAVMTLLAAHPGGLGRDEIATTLHPGVEHSLARGRVHTDIDAARSLLRQATAATGKARFVVYDSKGRRYMLDPDLVAVDLWQMLTCIETANRADDDHAALAALRQATSLSSGDFAAGFEQAWAIEHATTIRHTLTQAWARIAEILEADQPQQAATALESAIELEPINEELYRRLMRIHGRHGHTDQVRATLKLLEQRLAELGDAEPSQATRRVADRQLAAAQDSDANEQQPPAAPVATSQAAG